MSFTLRRHRVRRISAALATVVIAGGVLWAVPGSTAVTQIRSSDNYPIKTDPNAVRGKDAPGLAVDPSNPNRIVEIQLDLVTAECQYNTSTDGGVTWKGGILVPPPGYPQPDSCSVLGHGANAMDAGLVWGSGQTVYVIWRSAIGSNGTSILLSKSTDGGQTFGVATVVAPGLSGEEASDYEFPKIAVRRGAGAGGADQLVIATDTTESSPGDHVLTGRAKVTTSNDGGATWSPLVNANADVSPQNPFGAIEHTQPVFGPHGEIYLAWRTAPTVAGNDPALPFGYIQVGKSTDFGRTWTQVNATNVKGETYVGPAPGGPYPPRGPYSQSPQRYCCSSFPRLAGDPASGNLYLVWAQDPHLYTGGAQFQAQDHFMVQRSQVWFMRSTDGSASWTDRKQISESPKTNLPDWAVENPETQTRHPNVFVAPNGRVDIVWHDRRHSYRARTQTHESCNEARLGDTYYSYSENQGGSFSQNRRITDRSTNNDVGFDYRFATYWNFGPVLAELGNNRLLFAWQDSRLGNADNDTQDMFLARTDLNASGPPPVKSLGASNLPTDLSVKMSRATYPGGGEATLVATFASRPATRVVIARDGDASGGLAGPVLARANLGPLLLSPPGGLTPDEKAEVARLAPIGAFIIGDTTTMTPRIEADLTAAGVPGDQIQRLTGASPAEVAANIATFPCPEPLQGQVGPQPRCLDRRTPTQKTAGVPAYDAVIIANPQSPDAYTAATLAANRRLPFLYVDKNGIPPATANALASLNITNTLVVGGTNWVSNAVVSQLASANRNPKRLDGGDQYATSRAVVQESI